MAKTIPGDRQVRLPMARLVGVAVGLCIAVGGAWAGLTIAFGGTQLTALTGLVAAGLVAAASTVALLVIQPWRERSIFTWPAIWLAGGWIRMVLALGGAFLLYSATPFRGSGLWAGAAIAYVAVLIGESRVFVSSMRSMDPDASTASEPPTPE